MAGLTEIVPVAAYKRLMDINFFVPVALTYELLPELKKTLGSRVIFLSSLLARLHWMGKATYGASKCAIEGYADTLRVEMAPWGVKIVTLRPGGIRTPIHMQNSYDGGSNKWPKDLVLVRRWSWRT